MQLPLSIPELLKLAFAAGFNVGWDTGKDYVTMSNGASASRECAEQYEEFMLTLGLDLN